MNNNNKLCEKFLCFYYVVDTNDFNPSNITVPFIPDFFQDSPQRFQAVSIDIVDDSADEASQQFFLAHLQLLSAARTDLIDVSFMDTRNCTITDNDSELLQVVSIIFR